MHEMPASPQLIAKDSETPLQFLRSVSVWDSGRFVQPAATKGNRQSD